MHPSPVTLARCAGPPDACLRLDKSSKRCGALRLIPPGTVRARLDQRLIGRRDGDRPDGIAMTTAISRSTPPQRLVKAMNPVV